MGKKTIGITHKVFEYLNQNLNYILSPPTCLVCENLLTLSNRITNVSNKLLEEVFHHHQYFEVILKNNLCRNCYYELPIYSNSQQLSSQVYHTYRNQLTNTQMYIDNFYCLLERQRNEGVMKIAYALKYEQRKNISSLIALLLYPYLIDVIENNRIQYDYLVPVPLHKAKYRLRGFNQSELIANELNKLTNIQVNNNLIVKKINTQTQTLLGAKERFKNVDGVFRYKNTDANAVLNKGTLHLLLIDDILTTGSTSLSIAKALKEHYNCVVDCLTFIKS